MISKISTEIKIIYQNKNHNYKKAINILIEKVY